jgi:hypothetical protein
MSDTPNPFRGWSRRRIWVRRSSTRLLPTVEGVLGGRDRLADYILWINFMYVLGNGSLNFMGFMGFPKYVYYT